MASPAPPPSDQLAAVSLSNDGASSTVEKAPFSDQIASVLRIRHALTMATHKFLTEKGFPLVTDEDADVTFQVTKMTNATEMFKRDLIENPPPTEADVEAERLVVKERGEAVAQLKSAKASKQEITASVAELTNAKLNLARTEERSRLKPGLPIVDGKIDCSEDFFCRQAILSVNGKISTETNSRLIDVCTFGPAFRAETFHLPPLSRHLDSCWMFELDLAVAVLEDNMDFAEEYIQYMCKWVLEKCYEDMELIAKNVDKGCIDRLELVVSTSTFGRLTYTEAIKILEDAVAKGNKFENQVEWGTGLASEHERYLTEVVFQKPLIVYNYPKGIKGFYMRHNDDGKTVAAMDVIVPKVGKLISGSQLEERSEVLKERIHEIGLPMEPYEWYLEILRSVYGAQCGFGLELDRMVFFSTGMDKDFVS